MADEVLRAVGKLLIAHMRPYDLVSRYGGEEFIILLADTSLEDALKVAERIRIGISEIGVPGRTQPLTASFGVATLQEGQEPKEMVESADAALYRAKQKGRNRVEFSPISSA